MNQEQVTPITEDTAKSLCQATSIVEETIKNPSPRLLQSQITIEHLQNVTFQKARDNWGIWIDLDVRGYYNGFALATVTANNKTALRLQTLDLVEKVMNGQNLNTGDVYEWIPNHSISKNGIKLITITTSLPLPARSWIVQKMCERLNAKF